MEKTDTTLRKLVQSHLMQAVTHLTTGNEEKAEANYLKACQYNGSRPTSEQIDAAILKLNLLKEKFRRELDGKECSDSP